MNSISSEDRVIRAIADIDRYSDYNAVTSVFSDVEERAREVDCRIKAGIIKGRLAGMPIVIKDNICVKGEITSAGSAILKNFVSPYNATVIDRIIEAGLIPVAHTNMDEFAMGSTSETSCYGPVHNPLDFNRSAGGSSGGSAACVKLGITPLALGSDTGGSVRLPASYCGLYGLKPTYGSVSRYGLIAYCSSMDQIGIIGSDVRDISELFEIIAEQKKQEVYSISGGVRVAALAGFDKRYDEFLSLIAPMVASTETVELQTLKYAVPSYYVIATAEASSNLARYDGIRYGLKGNSTEQVRTEGFGTEVKRRIMLGNFVLSHGYYDRYYQKACNVRRIIKDEITKLFEKYDVLILPTSSEGAPLLGDSLDNPLEMYKSDVYTVLANLTGCPCITIPCGKDKNGMPLGLQIMGRHNEENLLLALAECYQSRRASYEL
ncbi:MAG: aspartyl/glutamyl-tRNA amidotransferase subunit A [Clostridia bacterium]|nr:aspartyl/glutamyl-tRNA amidotransferase subunit A [Clostridia bacterium]